MPREAGILLAVSGGADSLALLRGCFELAPEFGWRLAVGHVEHGWRRREGQRDLVFVREHARRLGLPFLARHVDARDAARRLKLSPEAGARHVRYAALTEMAMDAGARRIATAHQREDLVESYLIARERRGGLARLAGPRERRCDGVVRPLLSVSRAQILEFLASRGLTYRRDASNGDLHLSRNRIRRDVSTRGEEEVAALAAEAERLAGERERLERRFEEEVLPRLTRERDAVVADAAFLAACPPELARRALEEVARPFGAPGKPPLTGREREQILQRLASQTDFRFEAGRRIRFERRGGRLRVARARTMVAENRRNG